MYFVTCQPFLDAFIHGTKEDPEVWMETFPSTPFYHYEEGDAAAGLQAVSKELDVAMSRIALRSTNKMTRSAGSTAVTRSSGSMKSEMDNPMQMAMTFMQTMMGMGMAGGAGASSSHSGLNNFQVFANRQKKLPDLPAEGSPPSQAGSPTATVPALKDVAELVPPKNLFETQMDEGEEEEAKADDSSQKAPTKAAQQAAIVEQALSVREKKKELKRPAACIKTAAKAKVKVEQKAVKTEADAEVAPKAKAKTAAKQKSEKPPAAAAKEETDEPEVGGKGKGKKGKELKMDRKNIHCRAYNASLVESKRQGLSKEDAKKKASEDAQVALEQAGFERGK